MYAAQCALRLAEWRAHECLLVARPILMFNLLAYKDQQIVDRNFSSLEVVRPFNLVSLGHPHHFFLFFIH